MLLRAPKDRLLKKLHIQGAEAHSKTPFKILRMNELNFEFEKQEISLARTVQYHKKQRYAQ